MKIFGFPTPEEKARRAEQRHRGDERAQWAEQNRIAQKYNQIADRGVSFSALAALGAIVAAAFAGCAFQQAQRQADAAFAANRPWLEITLAQKNDIQITPIDPLVPKLGHGVRFHVVFNIKNVGHLPATQISYQTLVVAGSANIKNIQETGCDINRDGGAVIFPSVSATSDDLLSGNWREVVTQGLSESQIVSAGGLFVIPCVAYSGEAQGKRTFYTARVFRASFLGYRLGEKVIMYTPDFDADISSKNWNLNPIPWIGDSVR